MTYNDFSTLAVSAATPPPVSPTPPPGSGCADAHGIIGSFLCDPSTVNGWFSALSLMLWRWLQAWWPLLVVAAALALTAGAVLALVVRRARREAMVSARWVEIIPPASMPRDGAAALWHALAGLLHRTRRRSIAPRQLTVEFVADADGVRAGVWVPPAVPVRRVADAITRVWPGARVRVLSRPPMWTVDLDARVRAAEIYPHGGGWMPLVDAAPRLARRVDDSEPDPLYAVLGTLAQLSGGERACVQLVVTPERATRPTRRQGRSWWARGLLWLLTLPLRAFLFVVDMFLSGPSRPSTPTVRPHHGEVEQEDPVEQARRRAIAVKQGHGPHLRVTLRVAYTGPGSRADRREALGTLADGFELAAPLVSLNIRSSRPARVRLAGRRPARSRHTFAATVAELAALWHLPGTSSRYGITDSPTQERPPRRDLPRWNRPHHDRKDGGWDTDGGEETRDDDAA